MKAYVYGANGPTITDASQPTPKGAQVLVKVRACGLNRADLGMTKGHVHGSRGGVGTVLGMEWAGEVAALGPEAKGVAVGDRIMGSGAAAFAEYTLADSGRMLRTPSNMNFEEAATLPVALTTMHNAVVTNGALQMGQTVLVQGASSGVGLMAMQIAKLKGARLVVGSSTNAMRRGRLKEFGADLAIDSSDPAWVEQVLAATNGEGVDLIIDQVSGKVANQNLAATKIKAASSMSAGSAAPMPISISTCMRRAASTISALPSAPARQKRSPISSKRRGATSGARWRAASCSCPSTRFSSSTTSQLRLRIWKPTSTSARSS